MLHRIYKVMIKDYDARDADASIAEDWARDSNGGHGLSRKQFCNAFFELADTWTKGISAHEYAIFLQHLFETVTYEVPVYDEASGQLLMVSYVWKEQADVVYDEETYGEPEDEGEELITQPPQATRGEDMDRKAIPKPRRKGAGGRRRPYRAKAKAHVKRKAEADVSAKKIQAGIRGKRARRQARKTQKAVATIRQSWRAHRSRASASEP